MWFRSGGMKDGCKVPWGSISCGHGDLPPWSPFKKYLLTPFLWVLSVNSSYLSASPGIAALPKLCPFMCDQHLMTDQNETVITWLFLQPMGHCSSRFPVEPTETVMPAFNCTFCLMLLPAFSFHSYWCQRYPLINMPKPKLHLRSVS